MATGNWNGFVGAAKPLDDIDLPKLGRVIGVGEDELHAFIDVETRGTGFDSKRRPRILFERHVFFRELNRLKDKNKLNRAISAGLANRTPGGYGAESAQYGRLAKAMAIDEVAALRSASWGLGQIMGFNHKLAGYATVEDMVRAFMADEEHHLAAAVEFIKNTGLDDELRAHNWAAFAKGYNGPAYRKNRYDTKLAEAFAKWRRVKDTPWFDELDLPDPELDPVPSPLPPSPAPPRPADPQDAPKPAPTLWAALVKLFGAIIGRRP